MDEKDRSILLLLEENSRISPGEIALLVDLDEREVVERISAMEETGIIRNYTALIDWGRTGDGQIAAIVELKVSPERDYGYDKIAGRIARFRNVRSLRLVTGTYDLHLLVTGQSMHEIASFVAEEIAPMDGIRETATVIIMKSYKENGALFVERDEVERLPYSF